MTQEGRVKADVTAWFDKLKNDGLPLLYFRRQAGGFSYKMGLSDLYGIFNGHHFEVETKRRDGHQSVMQEKWQRIFEDNNVTYFLVNNVEVFKEKFLMFVESHI